VLDAVPRTQVHTGQRAPRRRKVSLIGWSLGGIYAREMAKEPDQARCVITLGTPFTGHPKCHQRLALLPVVSGQHVPTTTTCWPRCASRRRCPPPRSTARPTASWPGSAASTRRGTPHTENIEVHASHIGMGMNPLAMYAIADRLRQDPAHWKRFDAQGARRWFYKVAHQFAKPPRPGTAGFLCRVVANGIQIEVDDQGPPGSPVAAALDHGPGHAAHAWPQPLVQMLLSARASGCCASTTATSA
jgi:pimeloyl-ACP methyl ester carboxylesterase